MPESQQVRRDRRTPAPTGAPGPGGLRPHGSTAEAEAQDRRLLFAPDLCKHSFRSPQASRVPGSHQQENLSLLYFEDSQLLPGSQSTRSTNVK